jgi:nitrogen fixation NifU-like protein
MTETLKGKTREEAEALFQRFHDMVTGKAPDPDPEQLGKLAVFAGVSEFPARVKCATLCWHTARAAIEGREEPVSTE